VRCHPFYRIVALLRVLHFSLPLIVIAVRWQFKRLASCWFGLDWFVHVANTTHTPHTPQHTHTRLQLAPRRAHYYNNIPLHKLPTTWLQPACCMVECQAMNDVIRHAGGVFNRTTCGSSKYGGDGVVSSYERAGMVAPYQTSVVNRWRRRWMNVGSIWLAANIGGSANMAPS